MQILEYLFSFCNSFNEIYPEESIARAKALANISILILEISL